MRNALKKLMVFSMTGAIALSPMSAMAETVESNSPASGNQTGNGSLEGYVNKDVFAVVLPTATEATFKFTLDPQGLIAESQTSSAAKDDFKSATVEEGATLLFKNTNGNYTSKSDTLTAKNKGTSPVDVSVEADAQNIDPSVKLSSSETFDGTDPAIYLALTSGSTTNTMDTDTKKATLKTSLSGVNSENYQVKYNTDKYEYVLKDDVADSEFPKVDFNLTGASNKAADWSTVTQVGNVNVKWTLTKATNVAPSVQTEATYTRNSDSDITIPFNLGAGDSAATTATATVSSDNKTFASAASAVYVSGSNIVIGKTVWNSLSAGAKRYIKVTFDDNAHTSLTITVTIA